MTNEIQLKRDDAPTWSNEQRDLIRTTYASGASDAEFAALVAVAEARNLNPFTRQVFFVKRWDSAKRCETWTVQVSIDGLRAIADRTGLYAGQDEPEYVYDEHGAITLCKVRVYRKDWGNRACVGVAYWSEYVQLTKEGKPTSMWAKFSHVMIAKCAEALALRKAFPEVASGLYTPDEIETTPATITVAPTSHTTVTTLGELASALRGESIEQAPRSKPAPVNVATVDATPVAAVEASDDKPSAFTRETALKMIANAETIEALNSARAVIPQALLAKMQPHVLSATIRLQPTIEKLDELADMINQIKDESARRKLWEIVDKRVLEINSKRDFSALDAAIEALHACDGNVHVARHFAVHVNDLSLDIDRYDYKSDAIRYLTMRYPNEVPDRATATQMIVDAVAKKAASK